MESRRLFTVHSVYMFSFVSEISTRSVVSLVRSYYLRKFHFAHFILESFTFHIYLRKVTFSRLSQHFQFYLLTMFPHTGTQLYLLTMSFFPQPTNKQTFRRKADSNLTNIRQYGKTLRVEFTLYQITRRPSGQESSRQITHAHKLYQSNKKKKKTFSFSQIQPGRSTCQGFAKVV